MTDQTLWQLDSSEKGQFTGNAVAFLAYSNGQKVPPSTQNMNGLVLPNGQVRIDFSNPDSSGNGITGIGQMRWIDGGWTFQMQMTSPSSSSVVTHWAYMYQLHPGEIPPESDGTKTQGSPLSNGWSWLSNSTWELTDTALAQEGVSSQQFTISLFDSGYFWGQGSDTTPFTVMGSVTPEGNLLLVYCYNNGTLIQRSGWLDGTSSSAMMTFRSYDGGSGAGKAILEA